MLRGVLSAFGSIFECVGCLGVDLVFVVSCKCVYWYFEVLHGVVSVFFA